MGVYADEERIRAALSHVPAGDRDTWVQMGMAIKAELGEAGFDLWDDWSRSASSYSEADAKSVWKSFRSGGITIASLFKRAIEHGYRESAPTTALSVDERERRRVERDREAAAATELRQHAQADAAANARNLWERAETVRADHAYVRAKRIKSYGAKQLRDQLVVLLQDIDGEHHSAQYIQADGHKTFQTGGRISGCFVAVSAGVKPNGKAPLLICEGYATACSLHEATGYPVAAAMSAGNLPNVARAWREKHPKLPIVLCADDDTETAGNPGMSKATEAARAIGALLAVPDFGKDRPDHASDFNDLHCLAGLEAVRRCVDAATAPEDATAPKKRTAPTVNLSCAADIVPEPIHWLWPGWLPAGKLSILAGQPGCGKTTIAISLSSAISNGAEWPDGARCNAPGNVLIWTGEDGLADTLVPRLMAAGADLRRVFFVESITDEAGALQPFDPSRDVPILAERIEQIGGASMLVVDPIISVVAGDSHKSGDVRKSLQPLIDLGAAHRCAILGITHFSKGSKGSSPTERILGSQAFGAAARMILVAGKDDASDRRIFAKSKCNIAGDSGGFEYAIETLDAQDGLASSRIAWGEPLDGSAREILRELEADDQDPDEQNERESKFERARCMLYEWLTPFMSTKEMKAAAQAEGVSWRMVEAAKAAEVKAGNKIRAVKHGKDWGWIWDNHDAKYGDSTPHFQLVSSPQGIQLRKDDCGVESLIRQGLDAKSATPQSVDGVADIVATSPQSTVNSAHSGNHCGVADLTANPYPPMESTPQSSPQLETGCGLDGDVAAAAELEDDV
ncbi:AAA family ATPase [Burkholderia vietnamiensis]|uniref:TOPRIM domain protein n=1 Tax=Burkholderia vietnamiensis (strain G4 / LMG 22486) TaxID=269482 RepID=A4JGQ7_BURVG|nr:AAA family ATPase [Burkholderia vietnamiensis]ABO55460.1 TOPRIM domain protein [Burkholderia vietnamiensis G4]MCB4345210.1 AAA family ATPase [Burkholderia vietnamiensis]